MLYAGLTRSLLVATCVVDGVSIPGRGDDAQRVNGSNSFSPHVDIHGGSPGQDSSGEEMVVPAQVLISALYQHCPVVIVCGNDHGCNLNCKGARKSSVRAAKGKRDWLPPKKREESDHLTGLQLRSPETLPGTCKGLKGGNMINVARSNGKHEAKVGHQVTKASLIKVVGGTADVTSILGLSGVLVLQHFPLPHELQCSEHVLLRPPPPLSDP